MEEVMYSSKKERYWNQKKQYLREALRERTTGGPEQQQIFNTFLVDFNTVCKNSEQVVEMDEQESKRC